jgi:AcrR family transcriptional regulator
MGIQERKEREKIERRELILRCARKLVKERGVEGVSMGDIAAAAELSKATLYLYFGGKDELFQELCRELGSRFVDMYRTRLEPGIEAPGALKLFWECFLERFGTSDDLLLLFSMRRYIFPVYLFMPEAAAHEDGALGLSPGLTPIQEIFDMIRRIIERGIAEGSFEGDVKPALISHAVISLFSLVVEITAKTETADGYNRMIGDLKSIFQVIFRGISKSELGEKGIL